jgi:hypothetical protein
MHPHHHRGDIGHAGAQPDTGDQLAARHRRGFLGFAHPIAPLEVFIVTGVQPMLPRPRITPATYSPPPEKKTRTRLSFARTHHTTLEKRRKKIASDAPFATLYPETPIDGPAHPCISRAA